jgi:hypothetical protein
MMSKSEHYWWMIQNAFDSLVEPFDYIDFYSAPSKSYHYINENDKKGMYRILTNHLIGRIGYHDSIFFDTKQEDNHFLKIIKDADVFNYDFGNPLEKPHGTTFIDLDKVCFIKIRRVK